MQDFLVRKELQAALSRIIRSYTMTDEQRHTVVLIVGDTSVGAIPFTQFIPKLKETKIDEATCNKMAIELLGEFFLPLQWHLGNVEKIITELGGDAAKYITMAKQNYPEVYAPKIISSVTPDSGTLSDDSMAKTDDESGEPKILHNIDERLTSAHGRAEVLLRLVALSQKIEAAGKSGKLSEQETGELLHGLDALSYAVNTQDLNPLEMAAIKRRLKTIIGKVGE